MKYRLIGRDSILGHNSYPPITLPETIFAPNCQVFPTTSTTRAWKTSMSEPLLCLDTSGPQNKQLHPKCFIWVKKRPQICITPRKEEISKCIQDAFGWRFVNPPPSIEHASGPCQASQILRWKIIEFEVVGHKGKIEKPVVFGTTRKCCHHVLDRKTKNTNSEML